MAIAVPCALTACASPVANYDRQPERARIDGNFVSGNDAQARGGVGNYVSRIKPHSNISGNPQEEQERQAVKAKKQAQEKQDALAATQKSSTGNQAGSESTIASSADTRSGISTALLFEAGDSHLSDQAKKQLNQIAESIRNKDSADLEIEGYADATGTHEFNMDLSQRRAGTVRQYLIDQGLNPERVQTKAYGDTQARSQASNAEDRKVTITG